MKHTIEISTADYLLLYHVLSENNLENEIDKLCAERLKEKISEIVIKNLSEQQVKQEF